ncbi:MAG: DNA polymerase III subunit delta [Chitinophagaceae bacterium]
MIEKIINEWKKQKFKPVYWLEGDEGYFIDEVINYAEHHILNEQEAGFNLTVFYGKDAQWPDVINACRRYPMFAEKQVVLLKEAQQMKDIEKLEAYIEHPLDSTIFVVSYKDKKVDGRSKLAKLLKQNAQLFTTKKMYDNQLPDWTNTHVQSLGYTISQKALMLIIDHIGNDLSRLVNEVDKILVNLQGRKNITEDDIEQFVGISKEFNVFELQAAMAQKDMYKAMRIVTYFEANPKAGPIQLILPSLYSFFSKVFMLYGMDAKDEKAAAVTLGVSPFFIKDYLAAARKYDYNGVTQALLLLHRYNLRSVGLGDIGTSDAALLKELVVKMMH